MAILPNICAGLTKDRQDNGVRPVRFFDLLRGRFFVF